MRRHIGMGLVSTDLAPMMEKINGINCSQSLIRSLVIDGATECIKEPIVAVHHNLSLAQLTIDLTLNLIKCWLTKKWAKQSHPSRQWQIGHISWFGSYYGLGRVRDRAAWPGIEKREFDCSTREWSRVVPSTVQ